MLERSMTAACTLLETPPPYGPRGPLTDAPRRVVTLRQCAASKTRPKKRVSSPIQVLASTKSIFKLMFFIGIGARLLLSDMLRCCTCHGPRTDPHNATAVGILLHAKATSAYTVIKKK